MEKPVEAGDFDLAARLAGVEVVDDGVGGVEPDELRPVFLSDLADPGGEGALVLTQAPLVAGAVDQPSDTGVGGGVFDLLEAGNRRPDKVAPPAVMRRVLEFLPLVKRDAAADHDVFLLVSGLGRRGGDEQEGDGDQAIHEPRNLLRKMVEGKRICNFVSIADDGETLDPAEVFRVPCQKTRAVAAGGCSDPDVVV